MPEEFIKDQDKNLLELLSDLQSTASDINFCKAIKNGFKSIQILTMSSLYVMMILAEEVNLNIDCL